MSDSNEDPKTGVAVSDGPVRNPDFVLIRKERENRRYIRHLLSHKLSRKNLMALTGLFLCLFLVIHLFGNLQLLLPVEERPGLVLARNKLKHCLNENLPSYGCH